MRLEVPASCTVGLLRAERERRFRHHLVDMPGRRARARGAILGSESPALHRGLPSLRPESLGHLLELCPVLDLLGLSLQDQVEGSGPDRSRAPRVPCEVLGLASSVPGGEAERSAEPQGAQRYGMRAAVGVHRREPASVPVRSAARGDLREAGVQDAAHPAPRNLRRPRPVEVLR